jgi:multiple sugar transport system substrate-binding protein
MVTQPRQPRLTRRTFLGKVATGTAAAGGLGLVDQRRTQAAAPRRRQKALVTLTLAMYAEPSRTPIQKAMIADFERKHPTIKLNTFATDFSTFYTKMNTNIAAGTVPDVFMMSGAYFYNAAMKNVLKDLGPYIKSSGLNLERDYFTEPANQTYQGKTYGIPGEIDIMALAYNKDLFDAAGVRYPTNTWTWSDLLNAALKITRKDKSGVQNYGFYSLNSSQELWGDFVKENGGSFLTPDLQHGALDTPEAMKGIQFAIDLIYKYKVSPTPQGVSSLPGYILSAGSPFLTGRLGMHFQGNYEMLLLSSIKKFRWDVVMMPRLKKQTGLGWTQAWVMSANTPHPAEAWTLLHYLVTDGQHVTAQTPGRGLTPSLKSAAYSAAFVQAGGPTVKAWLDGWKVHSSFDFHPAWFEYQTAYSKALDPVFANTISVKEAMTTATQQVNGILARYPNFHP